MGCPFPPDSLKKASCVWELDYDGSRSQIVCSCGSQLEIFFSLKKEITKNGKTRDSLEASIPIVFYLFACSIENQKPDTGAWTEVTRNQAVISRFLIWCVDRELEFYQFGWVFLHTLCLFRWWKGHFCV